MYQVMVEARILDEYVAKLQRKSKTRLASTHGQEACRVSMAIELTQGDLVSDSHSGVVMDHLLGADIDSLSKRLSNLSARENTASGTRQLPWIEDVDDRLSLAVGAALAFKSLKQTSLVLAYVSRREAKGGSWRHLLTLAAKFELPIIFVVLPEESGRKKADPTGRICAKARSCGLPGIPVDASDAVALYRVAQESMGRIRIGGGAVVVECISYPVQGKALDPIDQMKRFLLEKKASPSTWLDHAGDSFRQKIQSIPHNPSKNSNLRK